MSEIAIKAIRTNTTTHRAVLRDGEIERILAEKVCGLAGIDRTSDNVQVRVHLSSRMGSCGSENSATVEVTIDHGESSSAGEV
ncbi:hypothetical protein [Burkholderia aenigmatica]|uniref:Uncharacterized protein n=1 Tax=Burkholderia aenigmatica TaxID=2015348 RepID=A0A228IK11_9BURK|nr:hypothetical protein [Burkholderia aenigmatica]OXI42469.1 hypothetical protein CFB84_24995 [Burkholderia aenigmatica]